MEAFMHKDKAKKHKRMFGFDPSIIAVNDPLRSSEDAMKRWEDYCRWKYQIVKNIRLDAIVEIGVRAGYSAWALLQANPKAKYYGLDANNNTHGGLGGPWSPVAEKMLKSRGYNVKMWHDFDSQTHDSLPIKISKETVALYHVDGDHTAIGAYNDITLCFNNAHVGCFILVDDYNPGPGISVMNGTDKWIAKHKGLVETTAFPDTGNGDMLIKIIKSI
jgi:hypothetical protein